MSVTMLRVPRSMSIQAVQEAESVDQNDRVDATVDGIEGTEILLNDCHFDVGMPDQGIIPIELVLEPPAIAESPGRKRKRKTLEERLDQAEKEREVIVKRILDLEARCREFGPLLSSLDGFEPGTMVPRSVPEKIKYPMKNLAEKLENFLKSQGRSLSPDVLHRMNQATQFHPRFLDWLCPNMNKTLVWDVETKIKHLTRVLRRPENERMARDDIVFLLESMAILYYDCGDLLHENRQFSEAVRIFRCTKECESKTSAHYIAEITIYKRNSPEGLPRTVDRWVRIPLEGYECQKIEEEINNPVFLPVISDLKEILSGDAYEEDTPMLDHEVQLNILLNQAQAMNTFFTAKSKGETPIEYKKLCLAENFEESCDRGSVPQTPIVVAEQRALRPVMKIWEDRMLGQRSFHENDRDTVQKFVSRFEDYSAPEFKQRALPDANERMAAEIYGFIEEEINRKNVALLCAAILQAEAPEGKKWKLSSATLLPSEALQYRRLSEMNLATMTGGLV